MRRTYWAVCCTVLAVAAILFPILVAAQGNDDPFGELGVQNEVLQIEAGELTPVPAVDPTPADDIPLPAIVEAQAAAPEQFCRCVHEDTSAPSVVRIHNALRSPLKESGIDFNEQALQEVVGFLQEEYGLPIKLDTAALDDNGIQADEPITVNIRNISLRAALRLMLKEKGLTYIIQDEVLMITTPDEAEQQLRVCVYDVRDLVAPTMPAEMDSLRDTIASCVASETWAVNGGGEAEIRPLRQSLLVISQTQAVHEEVRALLDTIRSQLRAQPAAAAAAVRPAMRQPPAADDAKVVTRSYYLQVNQQPGGESFASKIRELITLSLPDEQWAGRLDNNEPVVLTVLPDRVVLRHRQSVQEKVQSLLSDSGIASPPAAVAGEMGGGGFGGGGGGFFNPQPAENQ